MIPPRRTTGHGVEKEYTWWWASVTRMTWAAATAAIAPAVTARARPTGPRFVRVRAFARAVARARTAGQSRPDAPATVRAPPRRCPRGTRPGAGRPGRVGRPPGRRTASRPSP